MTVRVEKYDRAAHRDTWNGFLEKAKNGHFMFNRDYMEYHSDRFTDCSLLVYEKDRLAALFPANIGGDTVYSHQGLTFGGIITREDSINTPLMLHILGEITRHLRTAGVKKLVYKPIPYIYHIHPAEEDLYALFREKAELTRMDVSTVINYASRGKISSLRQRGARKAQKAGITYQPSDRWDDFWHLLSERLKERHGQKPVHTLQEIRLLASRFPQNIRLQTAEAGGEIQAGVVIFENPTVAHAQYICAGDEGFRNGALDGLFEHLIGLYSDRRYFSFGISTEEAGRVLNEGLILQKEGFGGSAINHTVFSLSFA
ncbi:MAG: GNAT family N-acetyltransferase [Pseudomonadota bacterium]|nr:GNAT family N-acetyltransferase [Pseudomonadota bacterium]